MPNVRLDLLTLPLRALVLLIFLYVAYYLGHGSPYQEWRIESPETGVAAKYTRNGRPWRILYDLDGDGQWDMWIDQRGGPPSIVRIDESGDGEPDRDEDEFGNPMPAWRSSQLRARKTFVEFLYNPRQLQYVGLVFLLYTLLEFAVRSSATRK